MFHKLFTRRRGMAIATVALGISGMSLALAGTAGAATLMNPPSVIAGSGSNTAYDLMTQLGTLFNSSPGSTSRPAPLTAGTLQVRTGTYTPRRRRERRNAASENPTTT